jgi:acyl-CoA dehydrogenase
MTDDRTLLRETAAEMVTAHCAPHLMPLDIGWQPELWADLESTGFTLVGIPEAAGGAGADLAAACDVLRELSKASAAVPFAESTLLAAWALAAAGADIPAGPLTLAVSAGAGALARVPYARIATAIVVIEPAESTTRLSVLTAGTFTVERQENMANEPRDDVLTTKPLALELEAPFGAAEVRRRAALVKAVAISGALDGVLALSVKYAGEREQFGRPLARFQSIQEMLAELAGETLSVRAATDAAIALAGTSGEAFAIAAAKTRASEAVGRSCRIAHQIHGALGFTDEHVLGRLTRRLWSWRDEAGNELEWAEELGRLAAVRGHPMWPGITAATA